MRLPVPRQAVCPQVDKSVDDERQHDFLRKGRGLSRCDLYSRFKARLVDQCQLADRRSRDDLLQRRSLAREEGCGAEGTHDCWRKRDHEMAGENRAGNSNDVPAVGDEHEEDRQECQRFREELIPKTLQGLCKRVHRHHEQEPTAPAPDQPGELPSDHDKRESNT